MSIRIYANQMTQGLECLFQGSKKFVQVLSFLLTLTLSSGLCLGAMEGKVKTQEDNGTPRFSDTINPLFMDPDQSTRPFRVQIRAPVEGDTLPCRDKVYLHPKLPLLKGQDYEEANVPLMLSLMKQAEILPEREIGKTILKDPGSEHLLAVNLVEVGLAHYDSFTEDLSEEERGRFKNMMKRDSPPLEILLTNPYDSNQCFPVFLEIWDPPAMAR